MFNNNKPHFLPFLLVAHRTSSLLSISEGPQGHLSPCKSVPEVSMQSPSCSSSYVQCHSALLMALATEATFDSGHANDPNAPKAINPKVSERRSTLCRRRRVILPSAIQATHLAYLPLDLRLFSLASSFQLFSPSNSSKPCLWGKTK